MSSCSCDDGDLTVFIDPATETVETLKAKVEACTGVDPAEQKIKYLPGGCDLDVDAAVLGDSPCSVPDGGKVTLTDLPTVIVDLPEGCSDYPNSMMSSCSCDNG